MVLERSTFIVQALPGLVIALALVFFGDPLPSRPLYQTAPLLVVGYAILFFPLALVAVRASVAQAPRRPWRRWPAPSGGGRRRCSCG